LDGKSFSSALYQVNNLLEYLINHKNIQRLENIQKEITVIIKQYEGKKLW